MIRGTKLRSAALTALSVLPLLSIGCQHEHVITSARQAHETRAAAGDKVHLRGYLTHSDPEDNQIFFEDTTGGVRLDGSQLEHADLTSFHSVLVDGLLVTSGNNPVVRPLKVTSIDDPVQMRGVALDEAGLRSEKDQYQLVELTGDVTSSEETTQAKQLFRLKVGKTEVDVQLLDLSLSSDELVGTRLRASGVLDIEHDVNGTAIARRLWITKAEQVTVLRVGGGKPNPEVQAGPARKVLTRLIDIRHLNPGEAAKGLPIHVQGVVSYFDTSDELLFVEQDGTGIYVDPHPMPKRIFRAGDRVILEGTTAPGDFLPEIHKPRITFLGSGPAPKANNSEPEQVFTGANDSEVVQLEGRVRAVTKESAHPVLYVTWGSHNFKALLNSNMAMPLDLEGKRVRLHGPTFTNSNTKRQMLGIGLFIADAGEIEVLPQQDEPESSGIQKIRNLMRIADAATFPKLSHVQGTVLASLPEGPTYVDDGTAAIEIAHHHAIELRRGDVVDVIGVASSTVFGPMFDDARVSAAGRRQAVAPIALSPEQIIDRRAEAELVRTSGVVAQMIDRDGEQQILLQNGRVTFYAKVTAGLSLPPIERGTTVGLMGVVRLEVPANRVALAPHSFTVELRNPADLMVLRPAAWWNTKHVLELSAVLGCLMTVAFCWAMLLRRQVNVHMATIAKKLQEEARLKRIAEHSSRAKGEFLANMSHEIRTPLNGILGFSELLKSAALDMVSQEHVESIRSCAHSLAALINDLLDLSRIEAGKLAIEAIPYELQTCVREAVQMVRPQLDAKGLTLTLDIGPGVPRKLSGDPLRLRQVLINLLGNAAKFTSVGGVAVTVEKSEAGMLRFAVRDTGIGIAPEAQQSIFEAFQQADGSITRRFGGTGLGLSICSRLIHLMDGQIGVESQPGVGSCFWFTLPANVASEVSPVETADPSALAGEAGRKPLSVLVAEDNAINQRLIKHLLEREGHRMTLAQNGREARDLAFGGGFDLILMDVQMPEMDGLEATRQIRTHEKALGQRVPIFGLTAGAMESDRQVCLECGMDEHIPKPLNINVFRENLRKVAQQAAETPLPAELVQQ